MGIFSDRCHALVDATTGKALTGDALEAAQADPQAPRCGNKVKKSARFCNKCGRPAPGGWWKCPSCGKWVGNESHFCWNCNTPLAPERRAGMAGGRWQHRMDRLAERFEVGDIKRLLGEGLVIEEGTIALLLDAGAYKDVLNPGRHNLDSLARKINHWGSAPPRTVVLMEASEIVLPLRIEGLRSAEELEVRFYGEAILKFEPDQAQSFLANLLKSREELSLEDVSELLAGEIRYGVENFCNTTTIEDIVKDPERRLRLEDELRSTIEKSVNSYGFALVRFSSAEFYGRAYEELRQKAGELEVKRREVEFGQKLRQLLAGDQMEKLKSEQELNDYVDRLAHERGITDVHRDHEKARLMQVKRHEIEAADLIHTLEQEQERFQHDLAQRKERDRYEREKQKEDLQAELDAGKAALDLKRERQAVKREDMEATAQILKNQDIETLIALVDDPDKRKQLLEVHKRATMKGASPEEILALTAGDSPQLASALAEIMRQRSDDKDEALQQREKLTKEHTAQLERILQKAIDAVGGSAKSAGNTTVINK